MIIKIRLLCSLIIFVFIYSCSEPNNNEGIKSTNLLNDDINILMIDTIGPETIIDKSKIHKAFDDIYFGDKLENINTSKVYTINNYEFNIEHIIGEFNDIGDKSKNIKLGLYRFRLGAIHLGNKSNVERYAQIIKETINEKYKIIENPNNEKIPTKLTDLQKAIAKGMGAEYSELQFDENYIKYIYQLRNGDIRIKIGLQNVYEYTDEQGKYYNSIESNLLPTFPKSKLKRVYKLIVEFIDLNLEKKHQQKIKIEEDKYKKEQKERDLNDKIRDIKKL